MIEYYMLFKIQKSEKDGPQSQFCQLNQTTLYFTLFTFLQIHTQEIFTYCFYLVNIILENSIVPSEFDIHH